MRNSPLCVDSLIFWVDFVIERICVTNIPWLGGVHLVCSQLEDYFIIKINTLKCDEMLFPGKNRKKIEGN